MSFVLDENALTQAMKKTGSMKELRAKLGCCLASSDKSGALMVSVYIAHAIESLDELESQKRSLTATDR